MPAKIKKNEPVSFNDYKQLKDEIIEISEQKFENILTKRLAEFKVSLTKELKEYFDTRFESIDARFESINTRFESINTRFESIEKRNTIMLWILAFGFGSIISLLSVILAKLIP